jgi:molecular chaperone DnaK (HSP70)
MITPDRVRIGIDFGTTNSSIGRATGGSNVELVRFAQSGGAKGDIPDNIASRTLRGARAKRLSTIVSARILDSSTEHGMPSCAASSQSFAEQD